MAAIIVMGEFRLPPESMAQARAAMARVIAATRAEPGCIAYAYAEDVLDPGLIRISESWESRAQLTAHLATAHMKQWQVERETLGLAGRKLSIYDVTGEEAL